MLLRALLVALITAATVLANISTSNPPAAAGSQLFVEEFPGSPPMPMPWHPTAWDVTVHSRDVATFDSLLPMRAGHGGDCSAPPATHDISSYGDAVFICRDHVMTAMKAEGYGVIYLSPSAMVDFSGGEAVVRFDVSTERTSLRDWIDLWVTPFSENVQLVGDIGPVDLNGHPRDAVQIRMDEFNGATVFRGNVVRDFRPELVGSNDALSLPGIVAPSASVRTTFEMRLSRTHLKFGIPSLDAWWVDSSFADLGWSSGVLQIGHHSYNPEKDCATCSANTWHWDSVSISPAIPFTILNADRRVADSAGTTVSFAGGAPPNSFLRFTGIGNDLGVSFDGGVSWGAPRLQAYEQQLGDEHFRSYWTPVPEGVRSVRFRGADWWGGPWRAQNIAIWATSQTQVTPTFPPTPAPTSAPIITAPPTARPSSPITPTPPPAAPVPPAPPVAPAPTAAPTSPPVVVVAPPAGTFAGSWLSQSAYPVLAPGESAIVTLRFTNTGSETWQVGVPGKQVNLGVIGDSTSPFELGMTAGWLSPDRPATTLERTVSPGGVGTFTFPVKAPVVPGVYRVDLALVVDGVRWLDDQGVYVLVTSDLGFHSRWISESPWPVATAGARTGPITVLFRNTGRAVWARGTPSQVNLGVADDDRSWADLAVGWLAPDRPAAQTEALVPPGAVATFVFELRAPPTPGTYQVRLRPVVDGLSWLEDDGVFVQITVVP